MRRMFGFLTESGRGIGRFNHRTDLMAPELGEGLRNQLRARGESFFGDVRHAADERKIELRQKLDTLRAPRGW